MSITRMSALVLLCFVVSACAQLDRPMETAADGDPLERQVLVLLRLPAPHCRPDASYTGSYDRGAGRDARRRIAERLANQYGLKIIDGWPVAALGVDCFVMDVPGNVSLARIVEQLSLDPGVESAQAMQLFRVLAHNDPLYPLQPSAKLWHLDELHKITWPTTPELKRATISIVVLAVLLGLVIGFLDLILKWILVDGLARLTT